MEDDKEFTPIPAASARGFGRPAAVPARVRECSGSESTLPSVATARDDGDEKTDSRGNDKDAGDEPETATATATAAPAAAAISPIPDGGLTAWLQVLCSWVVMVSTWGLVNTFGVYQTYYETELLVGKRGGSSTAISWIGSLQAALLLLFGLVAGPLYDMGFFRHLLLSGLVLIVFGQFMTSLCTAYWQLVLAQGVTIGLGMGMTFLPATAVLAQYFARRRALAIGLSATGSPLAGVVFPILFSRLQPRIGAAWATRVIAFILLGLAVLPAAFMRMRVPVGGGGRSSTTGIGGEAGTTTATTANPPRRALFDASALRELPFVAACLASMCSFLCLYVPFFYLQLFAERRGIFNAALSPFYLVTLLNVGSIFGRVLPNALADVFGSGNLTVLCSAASTIMLFAWLGIAGQSADATAAAGSGSHHLAAVVVFALLYGLFSGGIVSLIPTLVFALSSDLSRVGTRMGMLFSLTGVATLVGPPIAGAILGDGSVAARWMHTIGFSAAGVTAGLVFYAVSRITVYRQKGSLIG